MNYVQLGRYGDIIGILPVLYNFWLKTRERQGLVVSHDHANILDGTSYIKPLIFPQDRDQLHTAISWARRHGPVTNTQVNGIGVTHRRTSECFMRDSWHLAGQGHRWDQLSLVFDRRDAAREVLLAAELPKDDGRPLVLINLVSLSSPFPAGALSGLVEDLSRDHRVVDISKIRAHRLYDMLGILDKAHFLITADTSIMHLAMASNVQVLGLYNPRPWLGSMPRTNHIDHRPYNALDIDAMSECIRSAAPKRRKYVHVYPDWDMDEATRKRWKMADNAWRSLGPNWTHLAQRPERDSRDLGDANALPYVRDLIESGIAQCAHDDDVVVVANTDVGPTRDITLRLDQLMNRGAAFAYRNNHHRLFAPPTRMENLRGWWDGGLDLFAFTPRFWRTHQHRFPDMVMGAPKWDLLYRDIIKTIGGAELHGCVFHEDHASRWKAQPQSPSNRLNEEMYKLHCAHYDTTRCQPWYRHAGQLQRA